MHIHELNPKRTAVTLVLFTLIIIIGLLTLKSPRLIYKQDIEKTVEMINFEEGVVFPYEILDIVEGKIDTCMLIDLRTNFEFAQGTIPGSENISSVELLNEENIDRLEEIKDKGICVIVFANNQLEANAPWMVLRNLGFDNIKILLGGYQYYEQWADNLGDSYGDDAYLLGTPKVDYKEFAHADNVKIESNASKTSLKIIRKKKKTAVAGGC